MKLIEVKCPFCGGKIDPDKINNHMVTCEYCGNTFYLDDEKQQYITNYNIYGNTQKDETTSKYVLFGVIGAAVFFVMVGVIGSLNFGQSRSRTTQTQLPLYEPMEAEEEVYKAEEMDQTEKLYADILKKMFGRPAEQVSDEEIMSVHAFAIRHESGQVQLAYSMDDPYGENIKTESLCIEGPDWDVGVITHFPGLMRVELENILLPEECDLSGLTQLKGLVCKKMTAEEAAKRVNDPAQIVELKLEGAQCLEGIGQFTNLEKLTVTDAQGKNVKALVPLQKLKELVIVDTLDDADIFGEEEETERIQDYSALSTLTGLESLSLESDAVKDLGFLKSLSGLRSLTLSGTSAINLEAAAGLSGLEELVLEDNDELRDYAAVEGMTGLKSLSLGKDTNQPDPELSGLQALKSLQISGFMNVSTVGSLNALEELSIRYSNMEGATALSNLNSLEALSVYGVWMGAGELRNLDFVKGMTKLRYLDLAKHAEGGCDDFDMPFEVYGDVSAVFSLPALEELYLDNGSFEINFDRISQNDSLRVLGMSKMDLKENYYVESDGFMTSVWYDDVALNEHTDFLRNFPNLEELYLGSNELTDIKFAADLPHLKRVDISDNYVTDLSPLGNAEELEYLNVTDNPVSDVEAMDSTVEIVQ